MHGMRQPKTTQERRWSYAHGKFVRAKRKSKNLPQAWDDKWVSTMRNRCWKNYRKRQYKTELVRL